MFQVAVVKYNGRCVEIPVEELDMSSTPTDKEILDAVAMKLSQDNSSSVDLSEYTVDPSYEERQNGDNRTVLNVRPIAEFA